MENETGEVNSENIKQRSKERWKEKKSEKVKR